MLKIDQSVFIIGAPRSGTNMLRDVLASIDGIQTWPCDEINYIWRHGNIRYDSDEFNNNHARPEVKRYIRAQFTGLLNEFPGAKLILEKTCANSLRVAFVNEIFPKSKFIFIYRNGYDVTFSAKDRWTAPLDFKYLFKKLRYVPTLDIPFHAFKYLKARMHKVFSKEGALNIWGPVFKGMRSLQQTSSVNEMCAKQWEMCTRCSVEQLGDIANDRVHKLAYEDFVTDPKGCTEELLDFIGMDKNSDEINSAIASVHATSVHKGKTRLFQSDIKLLAPIIDPVIELLRN